jgi:hypothetical protein
MTDEHRGGTHQTRCPRSASNVATSSSCAQRKAIPEARAMRGSSGSRRSDTGTPTAKPVYLI